MEVYKDIIGYERLYQISNKGRLKSFKRGSGRILKPELRGGYKAVTLSNGKRKKYYIHVLIAMSFLDYNINNPFDLVVDHIDNNRLNNDLSNLQLISNRENTSKDQNKYNRTSKYTGVSASYGNWRALINVNKTDYHLGFFKSELKASIEYQKALHHLERNIDGLDNYHFENNRIKGKLFLSELYQYYLNDNL